MLRNIPLMVGVAITATGAGIFPALPPKAESSPKHIVVLPPGA